MLIDWFTVAAQIVNFLVLVALLRHFLYGPIIRAMDRREEQVIARIRDAETRLQEAEGEKQLYLDHQKALDRQRAELLKQARDQAEELRRNLTVEVRREVAGSRERWQAALARDQETFLKELRQRAGLQVFAVAARALAELADVNLEHRMIRSFIQKIGDLDEESRRRLRESARGRAMTVFSAFRISGEDQQRLGRHLREVIDTREELRFEVDPGLICGVRLNVHGGVAGWNLEEYLHELEQELSRALSEEISYGEAARREGTEPAISEREGKSGRSRSPESDRSDMSDQSAPRP